MDIGKDQHQEAFMYNVDEDFRDDEDDEDENRFIISLDDIEEKEDSLDECDNCWNEHDGMRAGHSIADNCASSPQYSKTTLNAKSQNVVNAEVNREDTGLKIKSFKLQLQEEQVAESYPSITVQNRGSTGFDEGNHLISVRSKNVCSVPKFLDSDSKECSGHFQSKPRDDKIKNGISVDTCNELPSGKTDTKFMKESKSSANHRIQRNFIPHENCTCIMCYQGRGVFDTNWIPKAAKRKMSMSVSQVPLKAMKQTSASIESCTNIFPDAQGDCGKNVPLSSQKVHVSSCKSAFSAGNPDIPLPVLTPKPPSHCSSTSSVTTSPLIASNLSSQGNVTLPANSLPLTTPLSVKMHPLASDKTHVVLINKTSVERQLTDLNCILQRATKVDLTKPGMALVHFKVPTPISNSSLASSQSSLVTTQLQSSKPSYKYTDNALYGLVKHHLINPSTAVQSSLDQTVNTNTSQKLAQNSLPGIPKRPNLLSKPHFPYSLLKRINVPGSSSTLPPPPPLQPCPNSSRSGASILKSPNQNSNAIDSEKHQTETIVLSLPKSEHNEKSHPQGMSVGISKQDELLSSPSLFTFCSPLELSPQKVVMPLKNGFSEDLSKLNRTAQCQQSFQNRVPACDPLSLSSSLSSSLSQPNISMKSSSVTSSTYTIPTTTVSSTMIQQSMLHFSSIPSNLLHTESGTHGPLLSENQIPNTSRHQQQCSSDIISGENSIIISNSSGKADSRLQSDLGKINISPTPLPYSRPSMSSQSSVSVVSNVNGLKMKIRFKDKMSDETNALCTGNEEFSNVNPVTSSDNAAEVKSFRSDIHPQNAMKEYCAPIASEASGNASASVGNNSLQAGNDSKVSGHVETAEEMFKRFEDQAMQQVYNAQFGVGEIQRNLRPNRTPFAGNDQWHSYAKVKTNPGDPSSVNQSGTGIQRKRVVKSKRRGSGDNKDKMLDEQHKKIDINNYPKLMQDNSILNRKTVFTPNILAGHKVYVKFNVFSNSQSGRSFLAPFFNIGGSRTQFDVEDMEYINKAVVECEKEEKSCARHLLFYSREGNKAVFLRKESGLHSNELSPKNYKKHSYILEGYTRERSKQAYQLSEKWKVDNKVQIEIDRAEQDPEIDSGYTKADNKSSDQTAVEFRASGSSVVSSSPNDLVSSALPISDFPNAPKPCTQISCESNVDLHTTVVKTVAKQRSYSHRDFVNILKRREGFQKKITTANVSTASLSSMKKSSLLLESHHAEFTEQPGELVVSGNQEGNESLSTSGIKHSSLKENVKDHTRENNLETVSHIKTEVPDDGYDAALNFRGNKVTPTPEIPGLTIKSEPINDYTESLARSMNVSLQSNHTNGKISPAVCHKDVCSPNKLEDLPFNTFIESPKAGNIPKTEIETQPKAFSDLNESISSTKSVFSADGVSHSCPSIAGDKIPTAETESTETASSNPYESSKMASSSEVETSDEEASDEDMFPLISSLSPSENTNASSVPNNTNTHTPAAGRKINSLVKSLAQRLSQNNLTLPPLFSTTLPRKKKKRKNKEKILQKHPDSKENSFPSTADVKPVTSVQSFAANTSQHASVDSPIIHSKTITATACENTTSTSRGDVRPLLSTSISSSHLSSGLSLPFSSFTSENSCNKSNKISDEISEIRASLLKSNGNGDQDKKKSSELLYSDVKDVNKDSNLLSHSLTDVIKGTSQLSGNRIKSKNNESCSSLKPKVEDKDIVCERTCKISGIEDDTKMTGKEGTDTTDRFPADIHSNEEIEVDNILCKHGKRNLLSNQDNEFAVLPTPKPYSNCSSPCSEIDVGMDEVCVERPAKCDSVPFGNLLASPPVPFKGKVCIKDFTKEHDLMVPFEAGTKPATNNHAQRNVKSKRPSPTDLSNQKSGRSANKAAYVESEEMDTGADLKPSFASLLCEKLAIEVEPVVPKPKAIKANPMFTNSKAFAPQEQRVPSVSKTSFYKPTLSAIFGVDDLSLPCPNKGKEEENKATPVVLTGKRRQVAVKGIHSFRRSKASQKLSPLKMRKQYRQEESRKESNTKTPNQPASHRKQKFGLQSFFRTWRQLSHEQKKKKQMKGISSQQIYTIPCRVVIRRLEDMQLQTNGQPVKTECNTETDKSLAFAFENNKETEQRSLNVKKRRKRTSVKVHRRRQPREKKDIVDYYASVLENLRKKAQMLEEEDLEKKESKSEKKKSETERVIKIEPITFQDDSGTLILSEGDGTKDLNVIEFKGGNFPQRVDKCEQIQDANHNIKAEDTLLREDKNVSVKAATSHNQDPINNDSLSKISICLQTSQSGNETHTTDNFSKCFEDKSRQVDTEKQMITVSEDSDTSYVSSSTRRDVLKDDLKDNQCSPTSISHSSTNSSSLPSTSNKEEDILRDEQFVEKSPVRAGNEDELKTDPESKQIPDSSFKTKDIVLGFENELGADTYFSTSSQGDMEDLFLLEEDEEDSTMGMIPQEEVEKLLGLDSTSESGFDNCGTKQQKAGSLKTSSALSLGNSDSKLQWVPLLETKEKSKDLVDEKQELLPCEEIVPDNQQVQKGCAKHPEEEESAPNASDLEYPLQSQQKKHLVSPSWNRLLGSEALRKMENAVPTTSQHNVDRQNCSLPSTSQLRVKFDPGALSRALKLSAEMKRVFADAYSKDASDQLSDNVRRDNSHRPEKLSHECLNGFDKSSDANRSTASSHVNAMTDHEMNGKGDNRQIIQNVQVGAEGDTVNCNKLMAKAIDPVLKDNQGCTTRTLNESSKRETRRSRSKSGLHASQNNIVEEVSDPNQTDFNERKTKVNSVSSNSDPATSPPNGVQAPSTDESILKFNVKTSDSESSSAVPTSHVRGIDLNKLKLKLNPLLSSNKRAQSAISSVNNYPLSSQIHSEKSEDKHLTSTEKNCPRVSFPDAQLQSDHNSVKTHGVGCSFSQGKNAMHDEFSKIKDSIVNPLGKQRTESEPILNTAKLCNILKNVTRPNSLSKSKSLKSPPSSTTSSYRGHTSMKSKNNRRVRSSSRSAKMEASEDPLDLGKEVHSIQLENERQKDKKMKVEEDKTERSFFDCLPGVISGVWDKS